MILAVAAPCFHQTSETFIRAHIKTILPDRTVMLCDDGTGADEFEVPVLSDLDAYPPPVTRVERFGNSIRFRWRTGVDPRLGGANERRVRAFFERNQVTHCLAEFGPMGCRLSRATQRGRVRLFVHFHGYDATSLARVHSWRRHYRKLFGVADGIIAPSRFIADELAELGCPLAKLHVSPCGVAPEMFSPSALLPGQVLAVGRFVEKKAPLSTIRAFALAADSVQNSHLHMVGDGPLFEPARALIQSLGLKDRVTLHGPQPHSEVAALLGQASVFVQHSVKGTDGDMEGLPVAILEAMAAGVPVVSTHHSGIPEAVVNGETGLLVAERDEAGMAKAISGLLQDRERAEVMGQAAIARVRSRFSHDVAAARLRAIMGLEL